MAFVGCLMFFVMNRREFLAAGVGWWARRRPPARWPVWCGRCCPRGPPARRPTGRATAPHAWQTADDRLSFVALGDNGSGGRQALAVAERMAFTYQTAPYGLVALLGDICYYGNFRRRFDTVFRGRSDRSSTREWASSWRSATTTPRSTSATTG